jgi:tetratricopeptide (TPR) repeat protein
MSQFFSGRIYGFISIVCLALIVSACSIDGQPQPSAERAAAVNQALRSALELPVPEVSQVASCLYRRDFQGLEDLYNTCYANYQNDVTYETPLKLGYDLFQPNSVIDKRDLDAWVEATGSAIAYTARGFYMMTAATDARGGKFVSETSKNNLLAARNMSNYAAEDLQKAVELDPSMTPAWMGLIRIGMINGSAVNPDQIFEKAIENDRRSFYLRQQYMLSLQPRWGGSSEAMLGFAQFCLQDLDKNPRFWVLQGDAISDIADAYVWQGDYEKAVEMYDTALLFGDKLSTLQYRAYTLQKCGRDDEAERDLRTILSYDPSHRAATAMLNQLLSKHANKG